MFASNAGDQETQTRKTVSEWLQATTETWDEIVALLTGGKDAVCGFRGSAEALQAFLAEAGLEEKMNPPRTYTHFLLLVSAA